MIVTYANQFLRPFASVSKRVFAPNNSFDNEFSLQVHFHANQTQFHMKFFTRGLALKQRRKVSEITYYVS